MVQRWSVQSDPGRVQDELLELYTSCNRINLRLWNEVSEPTIKLNIDEEAWAKLCTNYDRAKELTGLAIVVLWGFTIAGLVEPADLYSEAGEWKTWVTQNFTWLYILTQDVWVVFLI